MRVHRITSEPSGEYFIVTLHFSGDLRLPAEIQHAIQVNTLQSRANDDSSISLRGLDRENMLGRVILFLLRDHQITSEYLFTLRHSTISTRPLLPQDSSLLSALNFVLFAPIVLARIGDREGLISLENALRLQVHMQPAAQAQSAIQTPPIPIPQEGKNARALKAIKGFDFDSIPANFCCPLSLEIMDYPMIDPTTLVPAMDPNTKEPFINPTMPEHYKNYTDVAKYEKEWLLIAVIQQNGKSPNTRQTMTAPLIPDTALKSQIDAFVKTQVDAYESRVMHHVIGDLYFKIEPRDRSDVFTHDLIVIQNSNSVIQTVLQQKQVDQIIANIQDIKKLKLIMLSCGGYEDVAAKIINFITDAVKKQASVVTSPSALFGASIQPPSHDAAVGAAPRCN